MIFVPRGLPGWAGRMLEQREKPLQPPATVPRHYDWAEEQCSTGPDWTLVEFSVNVNEDELRATVKGNKATVARVARLLMHIQKTGRLPAETGGSDEPL